MSKPILYIFSGLPCSGKSTLSKMLVQEMQGTFVRIDTIEQGLKDVCGIREIEGMGYRLAYRICYDNLLCGNHVIADSVNPIKLCRDEWMEVASSANCEYINIEIICSDKEEHRQRLIHRENGIENLENPSWENIMNREYHPWHVPVITVDTAGERIEESFKQLLTKITNFNKI